MTIEKYFFPETEKEHKQYKKTKKIKSHLNGIDFDVRITEDNIRIEADINKRVFKIDGYYFKTKGCHYFFKYGNLLFEGLTITQVLRSIFSNAEMRGIFAISDFD